MKECNKCERVSLSLQDKKAIMAKKNYQSTEQERSLTDAFYQRLTEAYGYLPEQLGRDISIGNEAIADIAIWRSTEARQRQSIPDICVVVICREEYIKIDANNYLEAFKEEAVGTVNFFVLHNLKETKVFLLVEGKVQFHQKWRKKRKAQESLLTGSDMQPKQLFARLK